MKVSVRSDVGLVRQTNQDSYRYEVFERADRPGETVHLLAVADGMGGYRAGEVASRLALDTVAEEIGRALASGEALETALEEAMAAANRKVVSRSLSDPECAGMGTTVTVALVSRGRVHIGHVGDSRAYIVRGGRAQQVTRDHSLVAELVRNGDLTEAEAQVHPQRNILTQAFGSDLRVRADITSSPLQEGDLIMLCTDGLTGVVPTAEIEQVIGSSQSLDEATARLVALSNERGGFDNVTVLLAGPVSSGGDRG